MRAVVMEKYNNHIIVLTNDGQFKKINMSKDQVEIGMEINIADPIHQNIRRIAAIIVVVILMSGFGVSAYAYYTPYGHINLDINPSVEIIYNRFNRVLKMNGMNEDGKNLVGSIEHYKFEKIEEMMSEIINQSIQEHNSEETHVLITYDKIKKDTLDLVKEAIGEDSKVNVYTVEIPTREYETAKKNDTSPGKASLIKNIKKNNPNYNTKELEQKSLKELIEMSDVQNKINDERKINKDQKNDQKQNNKYKDKEVPKGKNKKDREELDDRQSKKESNENKEDDERIDEEDKAIKNVVKNNKKKKKEEVEDLEERKEKEKEDDREKEEDDDEDDKEDDGDKEDKEEDDDDKKIRDKREREEDKEETKERNKENKGNNEGRYKKNINKDQKGNKK